jgi:hypothetical protein
MANDKTIDESTRTYEKLDKGTIDVIVGERFKIVGHTPVHITAELSFPEDAFNMTQRKGRVSKKLIGGRAPVFYTLEALIPGTYEIECQHFEPPGEEKPGQVMSADLYHVKVSPKD